MAPDSKESDVDKLVKIGLSEKKAKETLKNNNLSTKLREIISQAETCNADFNNKQVGTLLYSLAAEIKPQIKHHQSFLVRYICEEKLDNKPRLTAALEYLISNPTNDVDVANFEAFCGIGVVVSPDDIEKVVEEIVSNHRDGLTSDRYRYNIGKILADARSRLKWGDGKRIKNEVDLQVMLLLGPKTDADNEKPSKKPTKTDKKGKQEMAENSANNVNSDDGSATMAELLKTRVNFHKPGENYKTDGYVITDNTMELLQEHLKQTGRKVQSRFPPEPNGVLHIGHAKAINVNFGYAAAHDGYCNLRYDDTNPEKEDEKFFVAIKDIIEWLGYKPSRITHSSDYFDQLYELAKRLIRKGLAYVCHQKSEEMKGFNPPPSPYRDRPIQENLDLFEDMKNGKFDEGKATLRMKLILEEGKVDPVAYRIKYSPHHRTGNRWCVYPTYDYTHCICDSLENITHSLCTKEFQSRRSSYYWLCNSLDIYCPVQWEYGRLNMNYTVVSKRKISKLITAGIVKDWDDPRLFTLTALRRRGFPSEAINNFCARVGLTMAKVMIDPQMLESCVRDVLNNTAPRAMAVLDPLKVTILNFPHGQGTTIDLEVPDFPNNPSRGKHKVCLSDVIYIERSDFQEKDEKGYRRLTPKQAVGLKHAGLVISVSKIIKDDDGTVGELLAECRPSETADPKPKAFVHWVSASDSGSVRCDVRLYDRLFDHKNPEDPSEVPDGFVSDCNPNSLTVKTDAVVDISVRRSKIFDKFQFERVGFFSVDPDTTKLKMIFNRTVSLKEDSSVNRIADDR